VLELLVRCCGPRAQRCAAAAAGGPDGAGLGALGAELPAVSRGWRSIGRKNCLLAGEQASTP